MKMPMPLSTDPAREKFVEKLLKHDIDVKDYCSVYEKSSIPPNNNLSTLALQIFERNACFVAEYSKYRNQLNVVIHKHLHNGGIEETAEGDFIILNQDQFPHQFRDFVNLASISRSEQSRSANQSISSSRRTVTHQPTTSTARPPLITTESVVCCDAVEKDAEVLRDDPCDLSTNHQAIDSTGQSSLLSTGHLHFDLSLSGTVVFEEENSTSAIENHSMVFLDKGDKFENESSGALTQQTVREGMYSISSFFESCSFICSLSLFSVTNTLETGSEEMVKKAMRSIMTGRSAIYTKTDLTQICNKSSVRLEAVKRLVAAKLLRHGDNYWIEPNRAKKDSRKESKRLVREGWLK